MTVTVQLLGRPRVRLEDHDPPDAWLEPALTKPTCLLCYLAYVGEWVERDRLTFLFWPDTDEAAARRNLRQLVLRARKQSFAGGVESDRQRVRWAVATDVAAFRQAVARQQWQEAVELYRGELLSGAQSDSAGFDAWLELEREALQRTWREAVLRRADELAAAGEHAAAAELLGRLLHGDELAEDVLQQYLRESYLAGRRDAALQAFDVFERKLRDELDLEPLEDTLELVATIRRAAPLALGAAAPAAPARPKVPPVVQRPPRLVGRDAELASLRAAREPLLLVAGEAGVGKSRLLAEMIPEALWLRCLEGMQGVPFFPLGRAVRDAAGDQELLERLGPYRRDLARLVPEVAPELTPEPVEPETARARLFEALARFLELRRPADNSGLPEIVLDDLQWADDATLDFVAFAAHRGGPRLAASYRHFEQTPALERLLRGLRAAGLSHQVTLEPLAEDTVQQLLADLTGEPLGPPLFSRWLHRTTGGNPMFMLEILKMLVEAGTLEIDEGGWRTNVDEVTRDYSELEVPAAVSEAVARRLARLSETSQRALRTAAVVGSGFDAALLARVGGLSEGAAAEALAEAEDAGLVHGGAFAHDLLRQSIYRSLSATQRRLLHARVADSLPPDTDPTVRAEQWLAAQQLGPALELWAEAATRYRDQGLFEPAIALLERAAANAPAEQQARFRAQLASLLQQAGRNAEALELIGSLLDSEASPEVRALTLNTKAVVLVREGRVEEAAAVLDELLPVADALPDESSRLSLSLTRAMVHHAQGAYPAAIALLEEELAKLRKQPVSDGICTVLTSLAAVYDMLGQPEQALPLHQEALRIARTYGFRYFQIDAALNLLYCLMDLGRTAEGIAPAEEALELGTFENTATLRANLATAYAELGRHEDALRHYRRVIEESEHDFLRAIVWARMAETLMALGQADEARTALDEAYRHAATTDFALARARVLTSTLRHGSAEQVERVRPWLETLDQKSLPGYIREELEQALGAPTSPPS